MNKNNSRSMPTVSDHSRIAESAPQFQHNIDRMRRAHAWVERSENKGTEDIERFMFLWVAFNAAYGDESALRDFVDNPDKKKSESDRFLRFLRSIVEQDESGSLQRIVWKEFSGPIRVLLNNHYVFLPFWKSVWESRPNNDWKQRFGNEKNRVQKALSNQDTFTVLSIVFHRLYVLRNQIFHGGATWPSGFGRDQIRDGSRIMASLIPAIIDIMQRDISRDQDSETWGKVAYPRINAEPE
ncbi:MAG: HEPN domain-containing protein [Gammaproteobacteria bacterium]|nr:HEPN domain-containing protein [Gammaproteobacteria bacterium]